MSKITKLKDSLAPDDTKAREQLEFLVKAAKGHLELFKLEFQEKLNNPEAFRGELLPVMMIESTEEYRADISEGSSEAVNAIVEDFFTGTGGSVKEGFKKIIKLAFKQLLGDSNIGEEYIRKWFITVEYGEIIRTDLMAWKYSFSSDQIISSVQNIYCFTLIKSFVDNNSLRRSQLNYFLAKSLGLTNITEIINNEDLKTYAGYLKESYDDSKNNELSVANYNALRWENESMV